MSTATHTFDADSLHIAGPGGADSEDRRADKG